MAPAVASVNELVRYAPVVDVYLIDPEPETEAVARSLIRLGEVQAVTSPQGLSDTITARDAISERIVSAMARTIDDAENAAAKALAQRVKLQGTSAATDVGFTAGYPPVISPDERKPLIVMVHPAHLKDDVAETLRGLLSNYTSDANRRRQPVKIAQGSGNSY